MKSEKLHSLVSKLAISSLAFLFFFTLNLSAQGDAANGKKLFNANCAACHKLDKKLVGPGLIESVGKRSNEWLKAWIKDNAAFQKVDADAKEAAEYSPTAMNAFPQLSDQDIDDIITYVKTPPKKKVAVSSAAAETAPTETDNILLYILGAIMIVMLLMLFNLYRTVNELKGGAPKRVSLSDQANGVLEAFKGNKFLHFLLVIFFSYLLYFN